MSQAKSNQHDPDMLDEYDFSEGVRGKYAQRYYADKNLIRLDDDVAEMFPDAKSVNEALRALGNALSPSIKRKSHNRELFRSQVPLSLNSSQNAYIVCK